MNTAFDFRDTETHSLKGTRVIFQRLHNESSDRLLKFENLLQEPHDNSFFLEWKALQTEYKIITEESEQPLSSPRQMSGFNQDTFRRAIIAEIDKQFQMRLKELETAVAVRKEEVDTLNQKLKVKQEEIENLSELSQELQLKEKKETILLDEINKLKIEMNEQDQREFALQKEKETTVARLTHEMDVLRQEHIGYLSNEKEQETTVARLTKEMDVLKKNLIVQQRHTSPMRIVLIGCTGVGKSSVGNTLLGFNRFVKRSSSQSVTLKCELAESLVGKRSIKVADTPPIINSNKRNMTSELACFYDLLAPGPHAIVIVIRPSLQREEEHQALKLLYDFFCDDYFLDFTLLVMVKKDEIIGEFGEPDKIHDYIENYSPEYIRQLYEKCNKRIVAVENIQSFTNRQKDAERVFEEIDKIDGYYSQRYFQKLADEKRNYEVIAKLEKSIKTKEQENLELKNRNCKQM